MDTTHRSKESNWEKTFEEIVRRHGLYTSVLELRELLLSVAQETRKEVIELIKAELEQGTGIGAIPETGDYPQGWNDCRKEAFKSRKDTLTRLLTSLTPPTKD